MTSSFRISLILLLFTSTMRLDGQWIQRYGFNGYRVYRLAASGTKLLAATSNGICISNDNAAYWNPIGFTSGEASNAVAISGNSIFAGGVRGVFRSDDDGQHWTQIGSDLLNTTVFSLACSGTVIYAGTGDGVYRSSDNGTNWVSLGLKGFQVSEIVVADTIVFASTRGHVYSLSKNNATWTDASAGFPSSAYVNIVGLSGAYLFATTYNYGGVYRSVNLGGNWNQLNLYLMDTEVYGGTIDGSTIYVATAKGVYRSTDQGITWTLLHAGLTNALSVAVSGNALFAGTDGGGVFRLTNPDTVWTPVNANLRLINLSDLSASGTYLFAATSSHGILRSADNGIRWLEANWGLPTKMISALGVLGGNVFTGTNVGVFRSADNGAQWTPMNEGLDDLDVHALCVRGNELFAATYTGVYRWSESSLRWQNVSTGLPQTITISSACFGTSGPNLFIATYSAGIFRFAEDSSVIRWVPANDGLTENSAWTIAGSTDVIMAGTDRGIFRSMDNGRTWQPVNSGLPPPLYNSVSDLVAYGSVFFATIDRRGVYRTTDNGASWTPINTGLSEDLRVSRIATSKTHLITGQSVIWMRPLSQVTSIERHPVDAPASYQLSQNYPNPFNPSTTIRFGIPVPSYVTLTIFDVLGRQVASLIGKDLPAGYHSVPFEALSEMASGVYLYKISALPQNGAGAAPFVETKKFLFLQ